jgi:hypothetical protein
MGPAEVIAPPDTLGLDEEVAMADMSARHEVRVHGQNGTIVFVADSSLGHTIDVGEPTAVRGDAPRALPRRDDDRDAVVTQARQRNLQAFAPWTRDEEREVRRRHEAGDAILAIARAHRRSPRAIELRLRRLGVLPAEDERRAG